MIKVSDYVFHYIETLNIKHVFLLSGGGCMHLVDSLGRAKKLTYVPCLHEQAAAIAASAYAQYTNKLGVALVTTGPGGTNAITGVAGAWVESTPLLILSGQVKRADMMGTSGVRMLGFQEMDIVSMVTPITKYAVTVIDPTDIRYHLEKAVYYACAGRPGPVWIDIPLDVQAAMIDETKLKKFNEKEIENDETLSVKERSKKVRDVISLINASQRPVILAGNGIKISHAERLFLTIVNQLKIPVLTTWKAMDILPESHKYFFGRPGSIGQRAANFIQQNSDLIITIGARLDLGQIGYSYKNFAREAKKVIIDIDKHEIDKLKFNIDIAIPAHADMFISEILRQKQHIKNIHRSSWLSRCKKWKTKYPIVLPEYWKQKKYVSTYVLMDVLSELMNSNDVFVPGSSGACSEIPMQALRVKQGQRILNSPGLGAMGFGVPSAIGACMASNNKRTICTNGDGGFQLNIQELATVKRLGLPIKYFVLNNDGYGSIRNSQRNYFNGRFVASNPASGVVLPNTVSIGKAYGIPSIQIKNHQEVRGKVKKVLSLKGPVICEVLIDPSEQTKPRVTSSIGKNGFIVTKPLEDLWPFLNRNEFISNMIIKPVEE